MGNLFDKYARYYKQTPMAILRLYDGGNFIYLKFIKK